MICSTCNLDKEPIDFHKNKCFKRGYAYWCKVCYNRARKDNPTKKQYDKYYRDKFKEITSLKHKQAQADKKLIGLKYYSKLEIPKCNCCGEDNIYLLTLDHIDGNGAKHRKEDPSSKSIYYWVCKNNYPDGFQVLCMNCNWGKSNHGVCPHTFDTKYLEVSMSRQ